MNPTILKYAGIGLVIVLVIVAIIFTANLGSQIRLNGTMQQVRIQAMDAKSCVVIIDFRIHNPADYPFIIRDADIFLEDADGAVLSGMAVAANQAKRMFDYYSKVNPDLGVQYNEVLIREDEVGAGATFDRMLCARFEIPAAAAEDRSGLRIRLLDVDGAVTEIVEERESE